MYRVYGTGKNKRIALPRQFCPLSENDRRDPGIEVEFSSSFTPRDKTQARVVKDSATRLLNGESFITQAPTGFGKTFCAMEVIAQVGLKTLVVVTKEDLRDQWIAAAKEVLGLKVGTEVGIVQGTRCQTAGRSLIIGMVQSLARGTNYPAASWQGIGLTIFDEVHRVAADHFSNTCWILPSRLRWGLSATPKRQDGKDELLKGNIGPVKVRTKQQTLIPRIYTVKTNVKFHAWQRKSQTPGRTAHLAKHVSQDLRRNHYIARFVKKMRAVDRKVIVFSDSLAHLDALRLQIIKVGLPAKDVALYVGGLTKQEREEAKEKPILLATYMYTAEATDIPALDTAVFGTPRSDVVQIVGRILRTHDGKRFPIVLDIIDPLRIYRRYGEKRAKWYTEIGAEIKRLNYDK